MGNWVSQDGSLKRSQPETPHVSDGEPSATRQRVSHGEVHRGDQTLVVAGAESGEGEAGPPEEKYQCHCRAVRREPGVKCTECRTVYHKTCLGASFPAANTTTEYVCSHCQKNGVRVGHAAEGVNLELAMGRAKSRWEALMRQSKPALCDHYVSTCRCILTNKNVSKVCLVQRIVYAEYGVDIPTAPPPPDVLGSFAIPPAALPDGGLTIAGRLYEDVMTLDLEYPGLGLQPAEPVLELGHRFGLLPHVMRHLDSCYIYNILAEQSVVNFRRWLCGSLFHWNGIHNDPQCKRSHVVCTREGCGRIPTLNNELATAALGAALERTARQYDRGDRGRPGTTPFDPSLDVIE
jgi:hypothetical protein